MRCEQKRYRIRSARNLAAIFDLPRIGFDLIVDVVSV